MSDLDVSLRLRLKNELSRPAEEAERDLKELKEAAERLGRTRGGEQLGRDIRRLGQDATDAKGKVGKIGQEANELREKLGRLNATRGLEGIKIDADAAKRKLGEIGTEAGELRQKLGLLGNGSGLRDVKVDAEAARRAIETIGTGASEARRKIEGLDAPALGTVKAKADSAEQAVRGIGVAADQAKTKLEQLAHVDPGRGLRRPGGAPVTGEERRRLGKVTPGLEGFVDRSGLDGIAPIGVGMGAGYLVGGGAGAAAVGVGRAYQRYAGDDRETEYILMNMGVTEADGSARRKQVRNIAKDASAPYSKTLEGLGTLAATGSNVEDAMAMLPSIMRTSLASNSEAADVARAAFAMQQKMGIKPEQMQQALDLMVAGGNEGMFEVPDMAAYIPDILTYASQAGFTGLEGLREVIARMQAASEGAGGNNAAAATQLRNVYAKMRSQETEKNFAEYGVNLPAEFKAGRAAGKNDLDIFYEAAMKASKGGNPDILSRLFVDQEAFLGLQSLHLQRGKYQETLAGLQGAEGTVERQWGRVNRDPQAALDGLANATDRAAVALGGLADKLGLTREINNLAEGTESLLDDPIKQLKLLLLGPSGTGLRDLWDSTVNGSGHAQERERDSSLQDGYTSTPGAGGIHAATGADAADMKRLRQQLGAPMDAAASEAMGGYNETLQAEGGQSVGIVQGFIDTIKSMLNFTAGPTIRPTFAPGVSAPAGDGAAAPQKQSLLQGGGINKLTQNISSPNSQMAARRAQREQNRAIRLAQARALHDLGSLA